MKIKEEYHRARADGPGLSEGWLGTLLRPFERLARLARSDTFSGRGSLSMNHRTMAMVAALLALLSVGVVAGCNREAAPPPPPRLEPVHHLAVPEYMKDTIAEKALISGMEWTPVRGYGLVYGLAGTGSTVHPPGLRERLVKELAQYPEVDNAEAILADPSTTIVQVTGLIPPGTQEGERFDLEVRVADGTQATSLEGGILKGMELRRVDQSRAAPAMGMVLARGEGAVFISPFVQRSEAAATGGEDSIRRVDPRIGRVLGGGRLTADEPRTYQLTLLEPSARVADQIVRLINARFAGVARGRADLKSVAVRVPPEFADEKDHFLRMLSSIYLVESPDLRERRMRLLADQLRTGPDYQTAVYGLLAFGQPAAILVEPLMRASESDETRYHAALTLARLGRVNSAMVLREFMLREGSPHQSQAARALASLPGNAGVSHLEAALHVQRPTVRMAAYQALVRVAPHRVPRKAWPRRMELGQVNSEAEPFIFISRQKVPRVVVFGDVRVQTPVLVDTATFLVTARQGDRMLTVMSKRLGAEAAVQVEPRLEVVINALMIDVFELGYSDVVAFLDRARQQEAISAPLVLEPLGDEGSLRPPLPSPGTESTSPAIVPGMRQPQP